MYIYEILKVICNMSYEDLFLYFFIANLRRRSCYLVLGICFGEYSIFSIESLSCFSHAHAYALGCTCDSEHHYIKEERLAGFFLKRRFSQGKYCVSCVLCFLL